MPEFPTKKDIENLYASSESPREPWNFCETPEEKCTMNYCDENGCQNRKRNLVEPKKSKAATFILGQIDKAIEKSNLEQQIEKTETLYRKVTFEIEQQDNYKTVLIGKNANFIFNPNTRNGEELTDFLSGCEEIPDPTTQLKADKVELLEALENIVDYGGIANFDTLESLIQKMKKCQENTPR